MALELYYHPLASFCQKVLIALYEAGTAFAACRVDLGDPGDRARLHTLWPVGKMPVLRDGARDDVIAETSIIIEYLDQHYAGPAPMLPADPAICLQARLWDRFFDLYVQDPMQKIVADTFRPVAQRDVLGVAEAEAGLVKAYVILDKHMADKSWAAGGDFSIADCSAAPALFYAGIVVPFAADQVALRAYFERLMDRPSIRRTLVEAQPYFKMFPFRDRMPERFLTLSQA